MTRADVAFKTRPRMLNARCSPHRVIKCQVHQTINNSKATQLIKQIYKTQEKAVSKCRNQETVNDAFTNIYQRIDQERNHFVMNTFIKLLIHFECYHKYSLIWNDIETLISNNNENKNVLLSFPSLLKCCVASNDTDIDHHKCIKILHWMQQTQYQLKPFETRDFSRNISAIIANCHTYQEVQNITLFIPNYDDIFIKTALMNAYARFDDITSALNVFSLINGNNINSVSVNTIMTVLINSGDNQFNEKALFIYDEFINLQNDISHNLAIKACCNTRNLDKARGIHNKIQSNIQINNTLINLYGCCHDIKSAINTFESIHKDKIDSVTINNIMKALINNEDYSKAITVYQQFSHLTNDISHVLAIKSCTNSGDLEKGKQIHSDLERNMNHCGIYIKTALIHFYGTFGEYETAESVFNSITNHKRDTVMLNAMINIMMDNQQNERALSLYFENETLHDQVSHILSIKCCSALKYFEMGTKIHESIGYNQRDYTLSLKHTLIHFYGHCGDIERALQIFDSIDKDEKNFSTINVMKTAYYNNNYHKQALQLYDAYNELQDDISHVLAIKACIEIGDYDKGLIISHKLESNHDSYIKSMLMQFHAHFGDIIAAKYVFQSIPQRDKDSLCINAMMKVYSKYGNDDEALAMYGSYSSLHDDISHLLAIKCCINLKDYEYGKRIHRNREQSLSVQLKNTLMDFYGKLGDITPAIDLYNSINDNIKTVITINALMNGYYNCNMHQECVTLFQNMCNIKADVVSYAILFKACIHDGLFEFGRKTHHDLKQNINGNEWMLKDGSIQVSLINMYGKYGVTDVCDEIFGDIRDNEYGKYCTQINIWHAINNAYSRNGDYDKIKALFDEMKSVGLVPDKYILIAILNSFSHSGDVDGALNIWRNEINDIDIEYDPYVITSMIDCFSRSGLLHNALQLILQYEDHSANTNQAMWTSLLSGCSKYNHFKLTQSVYKHMHQRFNLTNANSSITTLLFNKKKERKGGHAS